MAYKVIILYRLYMPSYFLGTFTEYPYHMGICAVPFGGIIQLFSDISFYFPFPCSLSGQS